MDWRCFKRDRTKLENWILKLIQKTYELVLEWIEYEEDRKAGKTKITFEILTGSNKDKLFRALVTALNKSEEAMKNSIL